MKFSIFLFCILITGCTHVPLVTPQTLSLDELKWEKLNPARGDKSPQAATLWGDRKKSTPTGFLVKFIDGFSSPPHIHNVSYKGIVIKGNIHNDDPKAAPMWMPSPSYWTQPAGESHITSAKGKENIAFIEIEKGPYLVKPIKKAFDHNERPINVHHTNIIWQKLEKTHFTHLWKDTHGKIGGSMIKYKKRMLLKSKGAKLVIIKGNVYINKDSSKTFKPGSFANIKGLTSFTCIEKSECILYIKSANPFKVL